MDPPVQHLKMQKIFMVFDAMKNSYIRPVSDIGKSAEDAELVLGKRA